MLRRGGDRARAPWGARAEDSHGPPLAAVCWAVQAQNKAEKNKTQLQSTTDSLSQGLRASPGQV